MKDGRVDFILKKPESKKTSAWWLQNVLSEYYFVDKVGEAQYYYRRSGLRKVYMVVLVLTAN